MINLIKNIFSDISLLYRNFLHFNLSKIVIYLVSFLYAIISIIPFIIFFGILYYYFLNSAGIYSIFDNIFISIPSVILAILGFFTIIIAFSYNYVLLTRLNLEYLEGNKLKLSKNYYFNFKLFWTFYKTMFLNFLIIILPFIVGAILLTILILIFGGVESAQKISSSGIINGFTISSFIILIMSILGFVYLMYKTLFTITILVDESKGNNFKKACYYIKKSFKLTSGFRTFFRFVVIGLLVFIITLPISIPLNYFTYSNERVADYIEYNIKPEKFDLNNSKTFYYVESLKSEFAGRDINKLILELNKNSKIRIFLEILNFLFIFGLFEMMIVSFYKRELLKNKTKNKSETKEIKFTKKIEKKKPAKKVVKKIDTKKTEDKKSIKKTTKKKVVKKDTKKTEKKPVKKTAKKSANKKVEKEAPKKRGRPRKTDK